MPLYKFNILLLIFTFLFSSLGYSYFSDNECLDINFDAKISHKGKPFGLFTQELGITKERCEIKIHHRKYKFLTSDWVIDVCREPIHIKKMGLRSVSIYRKNKECTENSNDEFCQIFYDVEKMIQADGLIFAKGEKEDLSSDHGKVFCSFLLLKKYLADNVILSSHQNYTNLLIDRSKTITTNFKSNDFEVSNVSGSETEKPRNEKKQSESSSEKTGSF